MKNTIEVKEPTKKQISQAHRLYRKHQIYDFGGVFHNQPVIELNIFDKNVFITQKCETGRHIGVHRSCEGDPEVIACWCGAGWCLFGRKFVETLTKEFKKILPDFTDYDKLTFEPTCVKMK